jgi:hypothetical protein
MVTWVRPDDAGPAPSSTAVLTVRVGLLAGCARRGSHYCAEQVRGGGTARPAWPGEDIREDSQHRIVSLCVRVHQIDLQASDSLMRFEPSGSNCVHELPIVLFVLVGVALGEVGDRPVEGVVRA